MGLFKQNYARPGRGISPEEAAKRSYFAILKRKISKIMQTSLVYTLINGVFWAWLLLALMPLFYGADAAQAAELSRYISDIFSGRAMLPLGFFIPLAFMGPGNAAISGLMLSFVRQEPCFVWSDFLSGLRAKFWQGLCISALTALAFYLYFTALIYYSNSDGFVLAAILGIYGGFVIFSVPLYAYTIMAAHPMKLWQILKSSLMIALANLPKTLMLFGVLALVHLGLMLCILPIWLLLLPVILFGWSFYTIGYVSCEAMEKYIRKAD